MKNQLNKNTVLSLILNLLLLITVSGCNNEKEIRNENKEEHNIKEAGLNEDAENHTDEVTLSEEQIKLMGIEFSKIGSQNINGYIVASGEIMIDSDNESKVGGIIPGRIKKIYVKEGSFVRAGQTLAVIENPDIINVQVEYINSRNDYEFAKQEYNRQQKLSSDNIGSKKNLAELESIYRKALANYKTNEEKLEGYKISKDRFDKIYQDTAANLQKTYSITAPISGYVVSRMVTAGQYVEPSTDMFHIVNNSTVFVDLNIYEKDLQYIKQGQKAVIESGARQNNIYEGKISFINKVFDDLKRTVKVRISIDNRSQELYPFMFVTAKIYVSDGNVTAVPVSAIETEGDNKYIFVKTNEMKLIENHDDHKSEEESEEGKDHNEKTGIVFRKYQIRTGISDDRYIEIFPLQELNDGDEVVSKGTFYLKSELKKEELGEHEH
ncbi:MAG: efflux RND transporter periplasmic adaptor subunit [Ignavibacteria bacterium]|nr:efflux RND transporter periplasmic adaptor subunit [Ignavibacteria bacterium]